jgi:phosphoribosylglycinamide formyltransferase-1
MRLAVLASGSGTILDAICAAGVPVAVVVADRECGAQEVAARNGLQCELVKRRSYGNDFDRDGYTAELLGVLAGWDVDLVAMAGFGTILGKGMFDAFPGHILNTHPALLPSFPGWHGVEDALAYGVKVTGCTVHIATDGAEGLRAATAESFDAVLMDVSMPVMNGMTATRAIRLLSQSGDERLEKLAAVPVIGVTAMARPEDLRLCLEAGMDAHLGKPLERVKLLRTLKDVMEAHRWLSNGRAASAF